MFDFLKRKKEDDLDLGDDSFPESPYPADQPAGNDPFAAPPGGQDPFANPAPDPFGAPNPGAMPPAPAAPQMSAPPPEQYGGFQPPQQVAPPAPAPVEQSSMGSDKHEIILAKLDTLKSMLDVLNQRMTNLEHTIREDKRRW